MGLRDVKLKDFPGGHFPEGMQDGSGRPYVGCSYCGLARKDWSSSAPCPANAAAVKASSSLPVTETPAAPLPEVEHFVTRREVTPSGCKVTRHIPEAVAKAMDEALADALDAEEERRTADFAGVGQKHDSGKTRWDLMPWGPVAEVADVLAHGARKYAPDNWRKVPRARDRYFAAAMRHLEAWRSGELRDPESGLPHLAHAICSLIFIRALERDGLLVPSVEWAIERQALLLELELTKSMAAAVQERVETLLSAGAKEPTT